MQKEYTFPVTVMWIYQLRLILCIISAAILAGLTISAFIEKCEIWVYVLTNLLFIWGLFKITESLPKSTVFVCLTFENITFKKWKELIAGKEIKFKWIDIVSYQIQQNQDFIKFKINLQDGRKVKFYHNNAERDYNYQRFEALFINNIDEHNKNGNFIDVKKVIYATKSGLVGAIFLSLILVFIPVFYIMRSIEPSYGFLLTLYSSSLLFIYRVYLEHKR
jgi:hypothetical protein